MRQSALPLLPVPRHVEFTSGAVRLNQRTRWNVRSNDARIAGAACSLQDRVFRHRGIEAAIVSIIEDSALDLRGDGYRIQVDSAGITLTGRTAAACFHGLQTIAQVMDDLTGEVACCSIADWPDFATRGLLFDVTRGKVPTLDTMKMLVDRLATLKINQLQLNIEHSFVFAFDPEICGADEGLTADEVRELDKYCQDRFIMLVPALANLGHMGRVLAMPRYRHLAEIETTTDWESMSWPQRLRGLTLDAANPQAWSLVERMWSDIFEAFSAPVVNICGDEPWDLGEGRNKERCARDGKADLYLGHLRRVQDNCAMHGRTTQFWGDVVRNYPHLLHQLRPEGAILHWGYDDRSDYEGTAAFVAFGLPTIVCPGTSGWKRTLNAIHLAELNIKTFAEVGKRDGAVGLVNTDWGDHGNFNMLASSWHGIALGAVLGWRADHPTGDEFDRIWSGWAFGLEGVSVGKLLRAAARLSDVCETWRILWTNAEAVAQEVLLPNFESAMEFRRAAESLATFATQQLAGLPLGHHDARMRDDWTELALAAEFTALAAEKIIVISAGQMTHVDRRKLREERGGWAERIRAASTRFTHAWVRRNKPMRLADIESAISRSAADMTSAYPD